MIVDGYVRVSHVGGRAGESFLSPTLQRDQIERWVSLRGALLAEVFEELDESGGRPDRPLLEKAVARVESGESNGLVVAYMSRFGRSLVHALLTIDRITEAGGTFVSVQEGLDFSTDIGRHMLRQMLSWAEWELDRNRAGWNAARERAVQRGVWMPGRPFGYKRVPGRRLTPHPTEGPLVSDLYRRRAEGASIAELRDSLVHAGVRTAHGKTNWRISTLCALLASRRYRGEIRHGDFFNPSAHKALVDEATWQRAQRDHLDHLSARPRRGREGALLRGILRCSGCQRAMWTTVGYRGASFEQRVYYCSRTRTLGECSRPLSISDFAVEPIVEEIFWQEIEHPRRLPGNQRLERLKEVVNRRERELRTYRDNPRVPEVIGGNRFAEGLRVRTRRVEQARIELLRAEPQPTSLKLPPPNELRDQWPSLSLDERRVFIGHVIEAVFVYPGRGDRLFVCRRGHAPPDLVPRHARRGSASRPFDPATCAAPLRLRRRDPDWSEQRIRGEVGQFLVGRERWPSFREFQVAGRVPLYLQIERQVGHREMASIMGLPYWPPVKPGSGGWSETRVRAELNAYLVGRTSWPTRAEFNRDGQGALRRALTWFGGPERWAKELGLRLPDGRSARQRWSYIRMRHELAEFTEGRTTWPTWREFGLGGRGSLIYAISKARAQDRLAADLELELPSAGCEVRRRRWNEARIREELDRFLDGRDRWPRWREFADAGFGGLYNLLQQTGTRDLWRQRYGVLPPSRRRDLPAPPTRWTDEAVRAELDPFLAGRTSWPRAYEFADAGLRNLHIGLRRAGTMEIWADRYGLPLVSPWGPRGRTHVLRTPPAQGPQAAAPSG